jgi:hypothetical protein
VAVPAGSLLLFPALMVHRSSPNTSSRQRRAFLLSFQPAGRPTQRELEWRPERVDELPSGTAPSARGAARRYDPAGTSRGGMPFLRSRPPTPPPAPTERRPPGGQGLLLPIRRA